jgi:CHAT domain-containing protein/tetratricopeptide (TPR) repeat protein
MTSAYGPPRAALFWIALGLQLTGCGGPDPPSARPAADRSLALAPGVRPEARLAGGESHSYGFVLPAGSFLDLTVEQHGIDIVVRLYGPDGKLVTTVDSPNGTRGPEPLPVLADAAGRYRLAVSSPDAGAAPGAYRIVISSLGTATRGDRIRTAAERIFAEGEELRRRDRADAYRAAVAKEQQALALFGSCGQRHRQADVLYSLGRSHFALGEKAPALDFYRRALRLFQELRDEPLAAKALNGMGQAHRSLGEPEPALASYRQALAIYQRLGDRWGETVALNDLGRMYAALEEFETALSYYSRALQGWRELGDRGNEGLTLSNRAELYASLGDPQRALDDLGRALPLLRAEGRSRDVATALTRKGVALGLAGRLPEGREPLEQALRIQKETGDRRGEAVTLNNLGWLYRHLGKTAEARRCYGEALGIFRTLADRPSQAGALANLGWLESESGNPRAAADLSRQAVSLFKAVQDREGEAAAWIGLAVARRRLGDLEGARAAIEAALGHVEQLRREPASHQLRSSFFSWKQNYYGFYVDLLMQLHHRAPGAGYQARALEASEAMRARSLLDMLADARADLRGKGDPRLLRQEAELSLRLNGAERRRRLLRIGGAPPDLLDRAEREVRRLLGERERLEAEIRIASPGYAALTQPSPLRLREIQERVLDPGTLLLEYALREERSYLWIVTPTSLRGYELPPRAAIEDAARKAYRLLASRDSTLARTQTQRALNDLSRMLLQPVAEQLQGQRLVIVADGALHYIPFGALPEPGTPEPLAARHEIVTLPSASSLPSLVRTSPGPQKSEVTLAVVADPVFSSDDRRMAGRSIAGRAGAGPDPAGLESASRGGPQAGFRRLPFSRGEAQEILALMPPSRRFAALDFAANRETVRSGVLSRYQIVHFATHAVLDTDHPELSGIVLSLVDPGGRPRDGFLRVHEIYQLDLPADLVVLSGCRTALGKAVQGEGLVGLTQGFFYAGARRVLVSLWEVEDPATAELMRRFYVGLLREGKPPAAALQAAQLSMARESRWRAPYYWAGFELQGDWR